MTTDPTTIVSPAQQGGATDRRRPARRGLRLLVAMLVGLALLAGGCGLAASRQGPADAGTGAAGPAGPGTSTAKPKPTPVFGQSVAQPDADADPGNGGNGGNGGNSADDDAEDALDAADDSAGYPDGGGDGTLDPAPSLDEGDGGGGVELEPTDGGEDACAQVLATGGRLAVGPDPAVLAAGSMSSHLTVTNCGAEPVDWTAATKPTVTLADDSGNLIPGSTAQLGFTIDADAYEPGAIAFKIKVSEAGHNHYVDVHAFRQTFGSDLSGDLGLSAGEGVGGCGNQCIVKALLTPNLTTPNLGLEVGTNTPATIRAYVSPNPFLFVNGEPQLGGIAPMASSGAGKTAWTTNLAPLQPTKKYHLVLTATDADGDVAHRATTFMTITPQDGPGDLLVPGGEPGCGGQCITKALLTPAGEPPAMDLDIESHTPARFRVWVSTAVPTVVDGTPDFGGLAPLADSGALLQAWHVDLDGLEADTDHHIAVGATDAEGRRSFRIGTFHTAHHQGTDVLITFQKVHVTHDGDSSWHNRGELSFAWGTADATLGTRGEDKIDDGTTIGLDPAHATFAANDVVGFLPTLYVSGSERDADGIAEFCSAGTGVATDPGHSDDCDAKWNVASSGLVTVEGLASLPRCSSFDLGGSLADAACMVFETPSNGDDYARFQVLVSLQTV